MKKFLIILAIILLATLQLNWPGFLYFFRCQPDLLLIFAVALVFYTDFKFALFCGVLSGLAKDVFLPWSLGVNTLLFSILVYGVSRLNRQISSDEFYVRPVVVLVCSLLNNFIIGLQSVSAGNIMPPGIFLRNLILVSLYSTLISPLIFKLTEKINALD
jgi:rod shape-determining protein MreD